MKSNIMVNGHRSKRYSRQVSQGIRKQSKLGKSKMRKTVYTIRVGKRLGREQTINTSHTEAKGYKMVHKH